MDKISLTVLAQALEDILRFELGLALIGLEPWEEDAAYEMALQFVMRYPTLARRLRNSDKAQWLEEIQDARQDARC